MEDWRGGGGRGNIACICTIEMADWGDVNIPTVTWNGDGGCGSTFPPPTTVCIPTGRKKGGARAARGGSTTSGAGGRALPPTLRVLSSPFLSSLTPSSTSLLSSPPDISSL